MYHIWQFNISRNALTLLMAKTGQQVEPKRRAGRLADQVGRPQVGCPEVRFSWIHGYAVPRAWSMCDDRPP